MKIIICVLLLLSGIYANDRAINERMLRQKAFNNRSNVIARTQNQTQNTDTTSFFVALEGSLNNTVLKKNIESTNVNTTSFIKQRVFGGAMKVGFMDIDRFIGGRFYAEGSYTGLSDFMIFGLGLNLDILVNFLDSKMWNVGVFAGIGGGMYVATFKNDSLNSSGKTPLSPAGWINAGFRFTIFGNQAIEITYRYPYTYASIYKDSIVVPGTTGQETTSYSYKSDYIGISYAFAF
ncbi:hypothetical protein CCY99_03635 [Helicobacter sp. 16-1353]|uniref:outer membrane beta-barrel protein n=1 Tax=Helicobacter sp. 16-1353 TaxID=2004996 RepID=UPI000DCBDEE8|nr:outer membrane beta-barrel protein [Helicobacter sp. 16-1353]RAX54451.1 hypothetical protein CCY99_03635 [Helicobacter sp. 16-1353]